jgi:putative metalloprotease
MPKALLTIVAMIALVTAGCEDTDMGLAIEAGRDAVQAVSLSDAEVHRLAVAVARRSDQRHSVAPADHPQARRLARLVGRTGALGGDTFNFKVYLDPTVNAFAMADGTIRIYSGLMEILDDRELLFVIGHEMGHVTARHIKRKIRLAYAGRAVRKAIASQQNEAGRIARSGIGALAEALVNAQFSQKEERTADDYGVRYLQSRGYDKQPAITALTKLAAPDSRHHFLSSHPAPQTRVARLRSDGYDPRPSADLSHLERLLKWIRGFWPSNRDGEDQV